ncbi:MAG: hypothetical protein J6J01_08775 [Oscillospiraceae bacterium]|nr:hypothetical protein [Oscillospiraceae bacterium]
MTIYCDICGQEINNEHDNPIDKLRCPRCGELAQYLALDIDEKIKKQYAAIHSAYYSYLDSDFYAASHFLESIEGIESIAFAAYVKGMVTFHLCIKQWDEKNQNVDYRNIEHLFTRAISNAPTLSSALYMANHIKDVFSKYAIDYYHNSSAYCKGLVQDYYQARHNYEIEKVQGNLVTKGMYLAAEKSAKKSMNREISNELTHVLSATKIAYLASGNDDLYSFACDLAIHPFDDEVDLQGEAANLEEYFTKNIKKTYNNEELIKEKIDEVILESPVDIKGYSLSVNPVFFGKTLNISFDAAAGVSRIAFLIIPFTSNGCPLYAEGYNQIIGTCQNVRPGKNNFEVSLPTERRMGRCEIHVQKVTYSSGVQETYESSCPIVQPKLIELTGDKLVATNRLIGNDPKYQWSECDIYWTCCCGKANSLDNVKCKMCGRDLAVLRTKASDEAITNEIEIMRREKAHEELQKYCYKGITVNAEDGVYHYDLEVCKFMKDNTLIGLQPVVYITNIGDNIAFIDAKSGIPFAIDKKNCNRKQIYDEPVQFMACFDGQLYLSTDRRTIVKDMRTYEELARINDTIIDMFTDQGVLFYLSSDGHLKRVEEKNKTTSLVSKVQTATVLNGLIVLQTEKGLSIGTIHQEKQKVGFLKKSYITDEHLISDLSATKLFISNGKVYYTNNQETGEIDPIKKVAKTLVNIPLSCFCICDDKLAGVNLITKRLITIY